MKRIGASENPKVAIPEKKPFATKVLRKPIFDRKPFYYYYTEVVKERKERD